MNHTMFLLDPYTQGLERDMNECRSKIGILTERIRRIDPHIIIIATKEPGKSDHANNDQQKPLSKMRDLPLPSRSYAIVTAGSSRTEDFVKPSRTLASQLNMGVNIHETSKSRDETIKGSVIQLEVKEQEGPKSKIISLCVDRVEPNSRIVDILSSVERTRQRRRGRQDVKVTTLESQQDAASKVLQSDNADIIVQPLVDKFILANQPNQTGQLFSQSTPSTSKFQTDTRDEFHEKENLYKQLHHTSLTVSQTSDGGPKDPGEYSQVNKTILAKHQANELHEPQQAFRARSSSPMWNPGSTSYAEILRGQQVQQDQEALGAAGFTELVHRHQQSPSQVLPHPPTEGVAFALRTMSKSYDFVGQQPTNTVQTSNLIQHEEFSRSQQIVGLGKYPTDIVSEFPIHKKQMYPASHLLVGKPPGFQHADEIITPKIPEPIPSTKPFSIPGCQLTPSSPAKIKSLDNQGKSEKGCFDSDLMGEKIVKEPKSCWQPSDEDHMSYAQILAQGLLSKQLQPSSLEQSESKIFQSGNRRTHSPSPCQSIPRYETTVDKNKCLADASWTHVHYENPTASPINEPINPGDDHPCSYNANKIGKKDRKNKKNQLKSEPTAAHSRKNVTDDLSSNSGVKTYQHAGEECEAVSLVTFKDNSSKTSKLHENPLVTHVDELDKQPKKIVTEGQSSKYFKGTQVIKIEAAEGLIESLPIDTKLGRKNSTNTKKSNLNKERNGILSSNKNSLFKKVQTEVANSESSKKSKTPLDNLKKAEKAQVNVKLSLVEEPCSHEDGFLTESKVENKRIERQKRKKKQVNISLEKSTAISCFDQQQNFAMESPTQMPASSNPGDLATNESTSASISSHVKKNIKKKSNKQSSIAPDDETPSHKTDLTFPSIESNRLTNKANKIANKNVLKTPDQTKHKDIILPLPSGVLSSPEKLIVSIATHSTEKIITPIIGKQKDKKKQKVVTDALKINPCVQVDDQIDDLVEPLKKISDASSFDKIIKPVMEVPDASENIELPFNEHFTLEIVPESISIIAVGSVADSVAVKRKSRRKPKKTPENLFVLQPPAEVEQVKEQDTASTLDTHESLGDMTYQLPNAKETGLSTLADSTGEGAVLLEYPFNPIKITQITNLDMQVVVSKNQGEISGKSSTLLSEEQQFLLQEEKALAKKTPESRKKSKNAGKEVHSSAEITTKTSQVDEHQSTALETLRENVMQPHCHMERSAEVTKDISSHEVKEQQIMPTTDKKKRKKAKDNNDKTSLTDTGTTISKRKRKVEGVLIKQPVLTSESKTVDLEGQQTSKQLQIFSEVSPSQSLESDIASKPFIDAPNLVVHSTSKSGILKPSFEELLSKPPSGSANFETKSSVPALRRNGDNQSKEAHELGTETYETTFKLEFAENSIPTLNPDDKYECSKRLHQTEIAKSNSDVCPLAHKLSDQVSFKPTKVVKPKNENEAQPAVEIHPTISIQSSDTDIKAKRSNVDSTAYQESPPESYVPATGSQQEMVPDVLEPHILQQSICEDHLTDFDSGPCTKDETLELVAERSDVNVCAIAHEIDVDEKIIQHPCTVKDTSKHMNQPMNVEQEHPTPLIAPYVKVFTCEKYVTIAVAPETLIISADSIEKPSSMPTTSPVGSLTAMESEGTSKIVSSSRMLSEDCTNDSFPPSSQSCQLDSVIPLTSDDCGSTSQSQYSQEKQLIPIERAGVNVCTEESRQIIGTRVEVESPAITKIEDCPICDMSAVAPIGISETSKAFKPVGAGVESYLQGKEILKKAKKPKKKTKTLDKVMVSTEIEANKSGAHDSSTQIDSDTKSIITETFQPTKKNIHKISPTNSKHVSKAVIPPESAGFTETKKDFNPIEPTLPKLQTDELRRISSNEDYNNSELQRFVSNVTLQTQPLNRKVISKAPGSVEFIIENQFVVETFWVDYCKYRDAEMRWYRDKAKLLKLHNLDQSQNVKTTDKLLPTGLICSDTISNYDISGIADAEKRWHLNQTLSTGSQASMTTKSSPLVKSLKDKVFLTTKDLISYADEEIESTSVTPFFKESHQFEDSLLWQNVENIEVDSTIVIGEVLHGSIKNVLLEKLLEPSDTESNNASTIHDMNPVDNIAAKKKPQDLKVMQDKSSLVVEPKTVKSDMHDPISHVHNREREEIIPLVEAVHGTYVGIVSKEEAKKCRSRSRSKSHEDQYSNKDIRTRRQLSDNINTTSYQKLAKTSNTGILDSSLNISCNQEPNIASDLSVHNKSRPCLVDEANDFDRDLKQLSNVIGVGLSATEESQASLVESNLKQDETSKSLGEDTDYLPNISNVQENTKRDSLHLNIDVDSSSLLELPTNNVPKRPISPSQSKRRVELDIYVLDDSDIAVSVEKQDRTESVEAVLQKLELSLEGDGASENKTINQIEETSHNLGERLGTHKTESIKTEESKVYVNIKSSKATPKQVGMTQWKYFQDVFNQFFSLDGSFWPEKCKYHDAEVQWQEILAQSIKSISSQEETKDNSQGFGDGNGDGDGGSSGNSPTSSQSPPDGDNQETIISQSSFISADLPGGIGSWTDESTYLATEPLERTSPQTRRFAEEVIADLDTIRNRGQEDTKQHLIRMKEFLASNIEGLDKSVHLNELNIGTLPNDSLENMLKSLLKIIGNLHSKDQEAASLKDILDDLPQDPETQALSANLAGIRTRISTLTSQATQGSRAIEAANEVYEKKLRELAEYQTILVDLEQWISSVTTTLSTNLENISLPIIKEQIVIHQMVGQDLVLKEKQLGNLMETCSKLQNYPETHLLVVTLLEQLVVTQTTLHNMAKTVQHRLTLLQEMLMHEEIKDVEVVNAATEQPAALLQGLENFEKDFVKVPFEDSSIKEHEEVESKASVPLTDKFSIKGVEIQSPRTSADDTIDSGASSIPEEEVSILISDESRSSIENIALDTGTQTGKSLMDSPKVHNVSGIITDNAATIPHQSVDVQIQTAFSSSTSTSLTESPVGKEGVKVLPKTRMPREEIKVIKRASGKQEIVEVVTKQETAHSSPHQADKEPDDLLVEIKYQEGKQEMEGIGDSELNITHAAPQSFETVIVDPDETTTEVIVNDDGSKRIIVRKTQRTVVSRQHHTVERWTSDDKAGDPVALSEVTLQGQQSVQSINLDDGNIEVITTQGYTGHVNSGVGSEEPLVTEFSTEPRYDSITYQSTTDYPLLFESQNVCDIPQGTDSLNPVKMTTSTSSVQAVVQQVTRRVIRRTRRVVRRIVIIDGKETVMEEIVEEPEEVEITEEGIPRVSINILRTQGDQLVEDPWESEKMLQHNMRKDTKEISVPIQNVPHQLAQTPEILQTSVSPKLKLLQELDPHLTTFNSNTSVPHSLGKHFDLSIQDHEQQKVSPTADDSEIFEIVDPVLPSEVQASDPIDRYPNLSSTTEEKSGTELKITKEVQSLEDEKPIVEHHLDSASNQTVIGKTQNGSDKIADKKCKDKKTMKSEPKRKSTKGKKKDLQSQDSEDISSTSFTTEKFSVQVTVPNLTHEDSSEIISEFEEHVVQIPILVDQPHESLPDTALSTDDVPKMQNIRISKKKSKQKKGKPTLITELKQSEKESGIGREEPVSPPKLVPLENLNLSELKSSTSIHFKHTDTKELPCEQSKPANIQPIFSEASKQSTSEPSDCQEVKWVKNDQNTCSSENQHSKTSVCVKNSEQGDVKKPIQSESEPSYSGGSVETMTGSFHLDLKEGEVNSPVGYKPSLITKSITKQTVPDQGENIRRKGKSKRKPRDLEPEKPANVKIEDHHEPSSSYKKQTEEEIAVSSLLSEVPFIDFAQLDNLAKEESASKQHELKAQSPVVTLSQEDSTEIECKTVHPENQKKIQIQEICSNSLKHDESKTMPSRSLEEGNLMVSLDKKMPVMGESGSLEEEKEHKIIESKGKKISRKQKKNNQKSDKGVAPVKKPVEQVTAHSSTVFSLSPEEVEVTANPKEPIHLPQKEYKPPMVLEESVDTETDNICEVFLGTPDTKDPSETLSATIKNVPVVKIPSKQEFPKHLSPKEEISAKQPETHPSLTYIEAITESEIPTVFPDVKQESHSLKELSKYMPISNKIKIEEENIQSKSTDNMIDLPTQLKSLKIRDTSSSEISVNKESTPCVDEQVCGGNDEVEPLTVESPYFTKPTQSADDDKEQSYLPKQGKKEFKAPKAPGLKRKSVTMQVECVEPQLPGTKFLPSEILAVDIQETNVNAPNVNKEILPTLERVSKNRSVKNEANATSPGSDAKNKTKGKKKLPKHIEKNLLQCDETSQTVPNQSAIDMVEISLSIQNKPLTHEKMPDATLEVSACVKAEATNEVKSLQEVSEMEFVKRDVSMQFPPQEKTKKLKNPILKDSKVIEELPEKISASERSSSNSSKKKKRGKEKKLKENLGIPVAPLTLEDRESNKDKENMFFNIVDEISDETSLAESTEIVITGGESSSDTTKPTDQEIIMFEESVVHESPRVDLTDDPGYDGEDKTTVDEISCVESDIKKSKKKKKRKPKLKVKDLELGADDETSWDLSDVNTLEKGEKSDTTYILTYEKTLERQGRKRKHDKKDDGPLYNVVSSPVQSFPDDDDACYEVIKDENVKNAEDFVRPQLTDIFAQQIKPQQVQIQPLEELEATKLLQDNLPIQTKINESATKNLTVEKQQLTTLETSTQINKDEFVDLQDESVQTLTPDVIDPGKLKTVEASMQTSPSMQLVTPSLESVEQMKQEPNILSQEGKDEQSPDDTFNVKMTDVSVQVDQSKISTPIRSLESYFEPNVDASNLEIQSVTNKTVPHCDKTAQTSISNVSEIEKLDAEAQTSQDKKPITREEYIQTIVPDMPSSDTIPQVDMFKREENIIVEELAPTSISFDSSVQAEEYDVVDSFVQTSTPVPQTIDISETPLQTLAMDLVPSNNENIQRFFSETEVRLPCENYQLPSFREESSQTSKIQTVDLPIQTRRESFTSMQGVQTSPQTETASSQIGFSISQKQNSSNQTQPVESETGIERQASSLSSDELYEVYVEASISFAPGENIPLTVSKSPMNEANSWEAKRGDLEAFMDAERMSGNYSDVSNTVPLFEVSLKNTDVVPGKAKPMDEILLKADTCTSDPLLSESTDQNSEAKKPVSKGKKSKRKIKSRVDKDSNPRVLQSTSSDQVDAPPRDSVMWTQSEQQKDEVQLINKGEESTVYVSGQLVQLSYPVNYAEDKLIAHSDPSKASFSSITKSDSTEETQLLPAEGPVPGQPVRLGEHSPGPPPLLYSSPMPTDENLTVKIMQVTLITDPAIQWKSASNLVTERVKNLQNARKTTHLSGVFYLATLQHVMTQESAVERNDKLKNHLNLLRSAVHNKDAIVVQRTVITTIETISTWLETIDYRVHLNRQNTDSCLSQDVINEFGNLKKEIGHVEEGVEALGEVLVKVEGICSDTDKSKMKECVMSLREHVRVVEEVTHENHEQAIKDLSRWEEFLNGVNNIGVLVDEVKEEFDHILDSEAPAAMKLDRLDQVEASNRCHMLKTGMLLYTASNLLKDFPGQEIPSETYVAHEITKTIEHGVGLERERLLQLLSLADEYEQTLQEFSQIVDIADAMVDGTILVSSLEHLQEEMQKHRKFFVNLSHCRGILESLEGNLDPEARSQHSELHQLLHQQATAILDKAAGRAQQMALAASRWTVLEQGMREEQQWLQVAHQRVPDLQTVTSSDYDQYISLYQSLSTDVAIHHARIIQLLGLAHRLHELVTCAGVEASYDDHLDVIRKLQETVDSNLCRLLEFQDTWLLYDLMNDKLEFWMKGAEKELDKMSAETVPPIGNMRQFWELKAQYEVHNNIRNEAAINFETSMRTIPVVDEMLQRQYYSQLEKRWQEITARIAARQAQLTESRSSHDVPIDSKLLLLEQELTELQGALDDMHGIIKNDDEMNLYIERVQVMCGRMLKIQEELGCLGLLSSTESEKVGTLLTTARRVEMQLSEELEGSILLRTKLQDIHRGIARVKRNHGRTAGILDQCEASETLGSDVVEQAVVNCQGVVTELGTEWQVLMSLRQLLHTLPMRLRVSVSPVKVEREISQLQDDHTALEARCSHLLALLRSRLALWRRFERQLEMVQQSVQEADYMMELLTVQGAVDYDRLLKATERLEDLYGSLDQREELLEDLRTSAEPLSASCSPEVSAKIEAAVEEAVTAFTDTCQSLRQLYTRYQDAVRLWRQYRDASEQVKAWADQQLDSVSQLVPEDALQQVKVCEETLAAHQARLVDLRNLVSQIAADVGLDAGGPLGDEVDALGQRLENVRATLMTLAATAESRMANQENLHQTKAFLTTVRQSLSVVEDSNEKDVENQLTALRGHLLALGRTEGQIQNIKKMSFKVGPTKSETSVVEILQMWQQVFRDTFQQYHRLSAKLVKSQDGTAVLRLWQEYLLHVQSFLSASIPDDYLSLTEHRHLCEVHQNLLTSQQSVLLSNDENKPSDMELSVAEQFNSLTNLHNETLARIMERHEEIRERLTSWDKYRADQTHLLEWLRDTERERGRLQLRYTHLRRVPKVLQRIESLLADIPTGKSRLTQLQEQQNHLVQFCDPSLATSIRMEHAAMSQRVSNLHAGLETWRAFLVRVIAMANTYDQQVIAIQDALQKIRATAVQPMPTLQGDLEKRLTTLKDLRISMVSVAHDLEGLGVTQEQLKESLSPQDMKTINQRVWLLWQQQGDLEHELSLLCHQLDERLGLSSIFLARQSRFISWASSVETRLEDSNAHDPEEVGQRYESDLKAEVALKRREYEWLVRVGRELVEAMSEGEELDQLGTRVEEILEAWKKLQELGKDRANKLDTIQQTVALLEPRLYELLLWVGEVEIQLAMPVTLDACTKKAVDRQLGQHDNLQKSIEQHSVNVADVLNLSEMILGDGEMFKTRINTNAITTAAAALDRRWRNVCVMSAERKQGLQLLWKTLQGLLRAFSDNKKWISTQDVKLTKMEMSPLLQSQVDINDVITKTEAILAELLSRNSALEILDISYSRLVKDTILEPSNLQKLLSDVRSSLSLWHSLTPRATVLLKRLHELLQAYHNFVDTYGKVVVSLTQIDVRLTQLQHLDSVPPAQQRHQIREVEKQLKGLTGLIQTADELALIVIRQSKKEEQDTLQEMINEYQSLHKEICVRLCQLKEQAEKEATVMDESIQVDTLRFEQDCATQVDTLPPVVTPRDAFIYELDMAIREARANLDAYQQALLQSQTQQPKLVGSCESSIELIEHLSGLLIGECAATKADACVEEVASLSKRFSELLSQGQANQQVQQPCDTARLTCPLCSTRNWQQLDNDLWRLEQWLQFAEGTQSDQQRPPSNIEQLEDIIQDHREFLLDLNSHKDIIVSLNIVGTHLADHTEDEARSHSLRERLEMDNTRWDAVCTAASVWQASLQTALMENAEFHQIISEMVDWLEKTELRIRQAEPVDITEDIAVIEAKYNKFLELRSDLERCEPRVMSLQEAADQLLKHTEAPEGAHTTLARLTDLRLRLQSLRRLTAIYVLKLGAVLGRDTSVTTSLPLANLSQDLLDSAAIGQFGGPSRSDWLHHTGDDEVDTSVLTRGYRFLGRVVRASLPIQALMLLLLGVAALVPSSEQDYSCTLSNTFARGFEPMLRYRNGPPPT